MISARTARPPQNIDAERSIIGSILLDPLSMARVRSTLRADDFYWQANGLIYQAAIDMFEAGKGIDNVTLAAQLQTMGVLELVGGRTALASMQGSVPTAANIEHYAQIVIECARKRVILHASRLAEGLATDDSVTADEAAQRVHALLAMARPVQIEPVDLQGNWPSPIAPYAFHGLAGQLVRRLEASTEADPIALLLHLMAYFGHAVGLGPGVLVEETMHGPNEFIALVGATSKARKGTAERRIRSLLRAVDEDSTARIRSGLSSGEGLIWNVRDPTVRDGKTEDPGEPDKRLLVVENELATVLSRFKVEGSTLSPILRDAWDRTPLSTLVSERARSAPRAGMHHISVVGHITQAELIRHLDRTEMANGLGNRFLWALVKRSRLLPRGGKSPLTNDLATELRHALERAWNVREVDFDSTAEKAWNAVYPLLSADRPGLAGAMLARAEAHVLRLALTYCLLGAEDAINIDHLLAALAVWTYCEDSVRCIFTTSLGDPDADTVLERLRAAEGGEGMTRQQLSDSFGRHWSSQRLGGALDGLVRMGAVHTATITTRGRPATHYRAMSSSAVSANSYVERALSAVSALTLESSSHGPEGLGVVAAIQAPEVGPERSRSDDFPLAFSTLSAQSPPAVPDQTGHISHSSQGSQPNRPQHVGSRPEELGGRAVVTPGDTK